jgi:hypothetical protein
MDKRKVKKGVAYAPVNTVVKDCTNPLSWGFEPRTSAP